MSVESLCEHTVGIKRRIELRMPGKSARYDWPDPIPSESAVECFVQPASAREMDVARVQKNYEISHVVWFPDDPNVAFMDHLLFGTRLLQVQCKAVNLCERDVAWRVDVVETQWRQTQENS